MIFFYPSDFEEELELVVGVEEILECAIRSTSEFASSSTFGETHFILSDYESKYKGDEEGDEEGNGGLHEVDNDLSHFSIDNIGINADEFFFFFFLCTYSY
jgi:hypothetical protein